MPEIDTGVICVDFEESRLTREEQTLAGLAIIGYDLSNLPQECGVDVSSRSRLVAEAIVARFNLEREEKIGDPGAVPALKAFVWEKTSQLNAGEAKRVAAEMAQTRLQRRYS